MAEERNQRPLYEGPKPTGERRSVDRRKSGRRKSDKIKTLFKALVLVIITVALVKFFKI